MSRDSGGEALIWLGAGVVFVVGVWIYIGVQNMANSIHVDMATVVNLLVRVGLLVVALGIAAYNGRFLRALPYLPCALLFVALPVLDYWSLNYVADMPMNETPFWYGRSWVQLISIGLLGYLGYAYQKWSADHY